MTSTMILPAVFIRTRKLSWKNKECHSPSLWNRTSNFSDCIPRRRESLHHFRMKLNKRKQKLALFSKFKGIWQVCNATYWLLFKLSCLFNWSFFFSPKVLDWFLYFTMYFCIHQYVLWIHSYYCVAYNLRLVFKHIISKLRYFSYSVKYIHMLSVLYI